MGITKRFIAAGGTEEEYNSGSGANYGPITALNQLRTDTASWNRVETLTSSDNVTINNGIESYTINYQGMKARLIGAEEAAKIEGNTSWKPSDNDLEFTSATWLFQNVSLENTDTKPWGYWTDSSKANEYGTSGWNIFCQNNLHASGINASSWVGVRPIVSVLKSNI